MVSIFTSGEIDREFESLGWVKGQSMDYENGICIFIDKHAVLNSNIKD
jgi:hypothetical protein